jgi:putative selenium metabolism hydrolase
MLSASERNEVLTLAQRMLRTSSLTGQEAGVAQVVVEAMRSYGYHDIKVDDWGNVIGTIKGQGTGSVLFDAHLDTVPWKPEQWQHNPLGGEVADGRIWGRGASDMKAAAAAAIVAVGRLARSPEVGTVHVCCTVCEEPAEGPALVKVCREFKPAAVVIMEASELKVNIGQRGRAELVVETTGKPAHSSTPHLGINAVWAMAALLAELRALALPTDDLLGPAVLEVTDVISSPYPGLSVVPYQCRATFDERLLVAETPEGVLARVQAVIDRLSAADPRVQAAVRLAETPLRTYTGAEFTHRAFAPAWKTPAGSPLVRTALAALQETGQNPVLSKYSFCTNGSGSAGILGIPTIGYGPGRESEAHISDEYLELDQLYGAAEGYLALALALSRMEA